MLHANAALTPRARLRLARLIVDEGWPVSVAAARFQVSWRTAKRWADRYASEGPVGMVDRSSRPHHSPNKTPEPVKRRIVHLRLKHRLGPVEIAAKVGVAASTAHQVLRRCRINRLTGLDRASGEPVRRYEHPAPGDMLHIDVKKLGNIPDGGGHRFVGRAQGESHRAATPGKSRNPHYNVKMGTAFVHTVIDDHSRVAYAEIHDDETAATATAVLRRAVAWYANAASPPCRCSPTTARPIAHTCGATPAPSSGSPHATPGHTGPRRTGRSNGSTAPWPTAGRSDASTPASHSAGRPCTGSSTSTTTTGPTPPWAVNHPSPG